MLRQSPQMRGVNDNWNESVKMLRLEVDQDKARALGGNQPVDCAGVQDHFVGHAGGAVSRG